MLFRSGVLGGERDLYVKLLQAGNSSTSGVDMSVNSGSLTYETGSGAIGMGSIQYDGDDNDPLNVDIDGLGSVDFTADGGRAFILDILESDVGFSFAINVWSDAGNDFVSNIYTALGANVPTQRIFNFSDFVGIDFTDVSALEFVINTDGTQGDTSIDFAVDAIRVPAPASIAFLGMGLLSLGYARRRHS